MRVISRAGLHALVSVALLLVSGCGESTLPTYPVSGQVVFPDGKTLPEGGQIKFSCDAVDPPLVAKGRFGTDGRFTLTTFREGDGAIAGEHRAMVIPSVPGDREEGMSMADYTAALHPIDKKFKHPDASGLKFTVSAETAPHDFRIEVTKTRKRRR